MQILAIMARLCKELSLWHVWNHIGFLDMIPKKGQPGPLSSKLRQSSGAVSNIVSISCLTVLESVNSIQITDS